MTTNPYVGDPQAIAELIAFHHAHFGDAQMTAGAAEGAPAGAGTGSQDAGTAGTAGAAGDPPGDAAKGAQKGAEDDWKVDSLPAGAQKLITDLRAEAAAARTAGNTKAETEKAALVQQLGKALGLIKDEDADKINQQELTAQLTTSQALARDNAAALIVWQNATALGVDPAALVDSRAFGASIAQLDPADAKFVDNVKAAAQAAKTSNPKLAAAPAAARRAGQAFPGGTGEAGQGRTPQSLDAAVAAAYAQ